MELYVKGHLALSLAYSDGATIINLDDESLLKLQDAIEFRYFKEDFKNFLELEHENACISDYSKFDALKRF